MGADGTVFVSFGTAFRFAHPESVGNIEKLGGDDLDTCFTPCRIGGTLTADDPADTGCIKHPGAKRDIFRGTVTHVDAAGIEPRQIVLRLGSFEFGNNGEIYRNDV